MTHGYIHSFLRLIARQMVLGGLISFPSLVSAQPQFDGPLPEPLSDAEYAILAESFEYDREPISIHPVPVCARGGCFAVDDRGDHRREKLLFVPPYGAAIPALLGVPAKGSAPHPLIILQYGTNGTKELFWEEGHPYDALRNALNAAGFAVLAPEMTGHGERAHEIGYADGPSLILGGKNRRLRDMSIQSVVELRQILDALEARAELDLTRVGSLGVSHGSLHSFYLAAVDDRIDAAVTWVTPMRKVYPLLYPGHFARRIDTAAVLMLAGSRDRFYKIDEAETVLGLIPASNKRLVVFKGGHQVRPEDIPIAVQWLIDHLGQRPR